MRITKAQRIMAEILKLQEQLKKHQDKCKHIKRLKEHGASTGNYDPNEDCYWTTFRCLNCLKQWTEDGSL